MDDHQLAPLATAGTRPSTLIGAPAPDPANAERLGARDRWRTRNRARLQPPWVRRNVATRRGQATVKPPAPHSGDKSGRSPPPEPSTDTCENAKARLAA